MKTLRVSIVCIAILMLTSQAISAPWIVSDPAAAEDQVTTFRLYKDGVLITESPVVAGAVRYDGASLPVGQYNLTAKFCNIWDCSGDSDPLAINKKIPGAPTLRIVP